ncbi:hypothetical protein [Herbidospora yilanensis]|uniref:hypothetical protein n=1 Tax=Herbidospora yilanensis TaxID=354426 RepID=UPI000A4188C0|nr:hypothetical protein [Herbidospora yilanensis]
MYGSWGHGPRWQTGVPLAVLPFTGIPLAMIIALAAVLIVGGALLFRMHKVR